MRANVINVTGTWQDVYRAACVTSSMSSERFDEILVCGPSTRQEWRRSIMRAEHSPIRLLWFHVLLEEIPYWVSVHLSRHKVGVEHFVQSQRSAGDRGGRRQDANVRHLIVANAQALVNISRKRLCNKAATDTRVLWEMVRDAVVGADPVVDEAMAPDCEYRGRCCEMKPCGKPGL